MSNPVALPQRFQWLEPFAAEWGELKTPGERYLKRQSSTMGELKAFHAAAARRLDEIFDHLDSFPMDHDLPEPEARLYRTVLGLAEVMQAVEIYGQPRIKHVPYPHKLETVWVDLRPKN
jgi:hypothetical protein